MPVVPQVYANDEGWRTPEQGRWGGGPPRIENR